MSALQEGLRGAPSSFARKARPRVQAKMEATGLVDVGFPFWCCRQCLVTVPAPARGVRHAVGPLTVAGRQAAVTPRRVFWV